MCLLNFNVRFVDVWFKLILQPMFRNIWWGVGGRQIAHFSIDYLVCTRKETMLVPLFTCAILPLFPTIVTEFGTTAASIIIFRQKSERKERGHRHHMIATMIQFH